MKRYTNIKHNFARALLFLALIFGAQSIPAVVNAEELCQGDSCDNILSNCIAKCQPSPYQYACTYLCLGPYTNCTDMMNRSRRLTVWRNGHFFLKLMPEQMSPEYDWDYPETSFDFSFGEVRDLPLPGNYLNGALQHSLTVWRPETGTWYHTPNPSLPYELLPGETATPREKQFGLWGDIPVVEDFHYQVWRPSSGMWFRQKSSGCNETRSALSAEAIQWGLPGDYPLLGRFKVVNPNSKVLPQENERQIAIYRPSDGGWYVRTSESRSGSGVDETRLYFKQFGLAEDHPMPGDYDGDGFTDLALWRPSTGMWFVCASSAEYDCSQAMIFQFGLPSDVPLHFDYDEDGKADFAVWRPRSGMWYIRRSSDGEVVMVQWGRHTDLPLSMGVVHQAEYLYPSYNRR